MTGLGGDRHRGLMRLKSLGVLLAALFEIASCGSSASSGPCAQRSGTYQTSYARASGNCGTGPVGDVSTVDAQPPATESLRYSADNCEVTIVDEISSDGTITITYNGKITWNQDGSHGSGPITVVVQDTTGVDTCHGTYNLTSDRI